MYSDSQVNKIRAYRAQWILPISSPPIENGLIIINDDQIQAVGTYEGLREQLASAPIDLGDVIIFPGFINVHTHLEEGKLPEPVNNFLQYLRQTEIQTRSLNIDQRKEIIQKNIDSCHEFGTVALGDFASDELSGDILQTSELLARIFNEIRGFKNYEASTIFRIIQNRVAKFPSLKKITSHLAMSSIWELSPDLLKEISISERHIAIHLAMTSEENDFMSRGRGALKQYLLSRDDFDYTWKPPRMTPVQYFFSNRFYARHNILVHINQINDKDIEIIKETPAKVNVCLCPRSAETLNLGTPSVKRILEKGVNICMGTESAALVEDLDMRKDIIECIDQSGLSPEIAIKFATLNGAYAIGFHKEVGSLDPGKSSRCLVIETRGDARNDPYSAIVDISTPIRWLADFQ